MMMMTIYVVVVQLNLLWSNPCQEGHSHRADGFEEDRPFNNNIIINNQLLLNFINVDFVFYFVSLLLIMMAAKMVKMFQMVMTRMWMDGWMDMLIICNHLEHYQK